MLHILIFLASFQVDPCSQTIEEKRRHIVWVAENTRIGAKQADKLSKPANWGIVYVKSTYDYSLNEYFTGKGWAVGDSTKGKFVKAADTCKLKAEYFKYLRDSYTKGMKALKAQKAASLKKLQKKPK